MGKFDLFSIMLQKPIYTAGETLIGTVNIKLKEKLKINGFNLLLIGKFNKKKFDSHVMLMF
jgi:hypothetical protein